MLISSSKATSNGLISKIDNGESWCNTMNLQQNYCDCNESQWPWLVLCSSLQENYPRARRCLDVYCVAQPQVEPGDEQSIHILNELYYGTRPSVYFKHLQTLQKTLASLDRFQDVSTCLKSIIVSPCQHLSRGFPCFYHLLPTSRLLALLEPKPQAFRRWDFALLFCHILLRFRWFAVHDINIYMNTKCDGERSLRFAMLCAYWFKGSSDASTCNLWPSLQKTAFVCPHKPHASGRPTTFVLQTSLLDLGLELTIRSAEILFHVTAITICWQACSLSVNVLPSWCWPWKESAAWNNWQFSYHAHRFTQRRSSAMSDNQHGLNVFDIVIF